MTLVSAGFVVFVCGVALVTALLPKKVRYLWLLCCSLALYIWAARGLPLQMPGYLSQLGLGSVLPAFLPPLAVLLCTTLASWLCGLLLEHSRPKALRMLFLCLGVFAGFSLWLACRHLGLFEHFSLYVGGIVTGEGANGFVRVALPLGLSYYSVQSAGYVLDVYAKRAKAERNPLRYAAFLSFFPAIFLGPSARATRLLPQLHTPAPFDYERVSGGIFRVLWGFFKKLLVADNIAVFTAYVLGYPPGQAAPVLALAALLFPLQLYMDFSGCCDIAVGAARMMGIDCDENFAKPFSAASFAALWQRWFVSFTGLLRDAVQTPLTGSRPAQKSPAIQKSALALGAVLCCVLLAAWHGFGFDWLLWGLATGLLVAGSQLLDGARERLAAAVPLYRCAPVRAVLRRTVVYLLFCASLLLFASAWFQQPFFQWAGQLGQGWGTLFGTGMLPAFVAAGLTPTRVLVILGGLALVLALEHFGIRENSTMADFIRTRRFYLRWPLYYLLIAGLLLFGAFPAAQGIYQGF